MRRWNTVHCPALFMLFDLRVCARVCMPLTEQWHDLAVGWHARRRSEFQSRIVEVADVADRLMHFGKRQRAAVQALIVTHVIANQLKGLVVLIL